jgi:hypothetical protein
MIERVKKFLGYKSDAQLARALGMSVQNFSKQKKTKGAETAAYRLAVDRGADPDWLLTGRGEAKAVKSDTSLAALAGKLLADGMGEGQDKVILGLILQMQNEQSRRLDLLSSKLERLANERDASVAQFWEVETRIRNELAAQREVVAKLSNTLAVLQLDLGELKNRLIDAGRTEDIRLLGELGSGMK